MLTEVISEVLEVNGQLPAIQRDIIISSIEGAMNDAAVKFSEVHADIQQKFVTTLTHDLKTPITAAKLVAQLILKRSDRPVDCIRSASRIIGNMNRLDSMIYDPHDVSRLRAGEPLSLQFVDCDVASLVRDVVDEFSGMYGNKIILESKGNLEGNFGCDGLRRAVENLLSNAVKYGTGGIPIKVAERKHEQVVKMSVHNECAPIPKEEVPLLFQQYRRSRSAHESSKSGWGLGSTLVKGVADAHDGAVEINSLEGAGTTSLLIIPEKPRS